MVDQYDGFVNEFGGRVNGTQTLGENIADNGGLHVAFETYRRMVPNSTGPPLWPDGSFTNNQLFFVSFAQGWCDRKSNASANVLLQGDVHAPNFAGAFAFAVLVAGKVCL